ncbi:MAG: methyltransferase domain-containing protein [Rhodobacteraceae bacterium]|nr:methyltransferase domain-containing protein [Paracoccaceae bacterium]
MAERLAGWRNRIVAQPRFQRWAARLPLTRGIARRDGERLFDLVAGFVHSQVLLACVELDLLEALRAGPLPPEQVALRTGLPPEAAETLVRAATALGLLRMERSGRVALGRLGAALLGVDGLADMIRHHRLFYGDLSDPVALLRGEAETELARFWPYVFGAAPGTVPPETAQAYSRLMASSQVLVSEETLRAVDLSGTRRLLDVGGGTGAFAVAVAARWPRLQACVFDLPPVAEAARARFASDSAGARLEARAGNFREESLPEGFDTISLIRVLYDHADATVAALLSRVAAALPEGGRIVISEPMSGGARPQRAGDVYFAFYTMAMRTGRVRAPERIAALLEAAGFEAIRVHPAARPFVTQAITARRGRVR